MHAWITVLQILSCPVSLRNCIGLSASMGHVTLAVISRYIIRFLIHCNTIQAIAATLKIRIFFFSNGTRPFEQFNSYPPSAAYMRQWIGSVLIYIMACRLFGAKPLSKPVLGHCQWNFNQNTNLCIHEIHLIISSAKWSKHGQTCNICNTKFLIGPHRWTSASV